MLVAFKLVAPPFLIFSFHPDSYFLFVTFISKIDFEDFFACFLLQTVGKGMTFLDKATVLNIICFLGHNYDHKNSKVQCII